MLDLPDITPVLLSEARTFAAYAIFFGSYLVFALGKFPWMKIDRPGAAIIGAVLMVACGIVGAREALAFIDFASPTLLHVPTMAATKAQLTKEPHDSRTSRQQLSSSGGECQVSRHHAGIDNNDVGWSA